MQRGPLFLAAAFFEVLRFFSLMFFAETAGFLESGLFIPSLFRYASVPQLLFAVAFFLLWRNQETHAAYRPLLLVGKAVSTLALLPLGLGFMRVLGGEGFIPLPRAALLSLAVIAAIDLLALAVLILYRRAVPASFYPGQPIPAHPVSGHPVSGHPVSGNSDAAPSASITAVAPQHGPDDIEKVEGLP